MIFYFSGTGNSKWVANELAKLINDKCYDICKFSEIPNIDNESQIGFIFPIYAWGVPEVMMNFVKKLNKTIAFTFSICTCGAEAGEALKNLSKIYKIDSCYSLVMPSNYIIGEDIEENRVIKEKLEKAKNDLENISKEILEKQKVYKVNEGSSPKIKSGIINKAFNKFGRTTKPFYVDKNKCISCGLCSKICPSSCITMVKGYPVWGKKCYQCLRCINYCPKEAIQYGKSTEKRGRYNIEKYLDENYSAIATVVSIRIGTVLTFVIDDENQFLDKGTYDISLTVLKSVKDRNGNEFDRFTLKQGDKIKITASPKKLHLTTYGDGVFNLDGITKLELLN